MRKNHISWIILLAVLLLGACSETGQEQPDEPMTLILVTNNSAREITSIELKLYQNDMVQASPTAMSTDESPIVIGETVEFEILAQDIDFEEPVIIEAVTMINGVEESAGQTESMEFGPEESYQFELAGGPELQFRVRGE